MGYLAIARAWGINLCAHILVSFTLKINLKSPSNGLKEIVMAYASRIDNYLEAASSQLTFGERLASRSNG